MKLMPMVAVAVLAAFTGAPLAAQQDEGTTTIDGVQVNYAIASKQRGAALTPDEILAIIRRSRPAGAPLPAVSPPESPSSSVTPTAPK